MTTRAPSPSIPLTTPIRSSKTYYQNVQKLKKMDMDYTGPGIAGYNPEMNYNAHDGQLPSVYDGLLYDSSMYQIYDSTFYVAGIVACTTLFITGVIFASGKY
jgi:hypothetical protein